MRAYYNEIDRFNCDWLQTLMDRGLITPGKIDDRSIVDVRPDDVAGFERAHFFAGIGGWEYALSLAGWAGPVWTGSCPCQPFSQAGKRKGFDDRRHLWPIFRDLIAKCGPTIVFGEQVASKAGRVWLSGVRADLEALARSVGAADLCAAGVSAPHIRQRLYWVGVANSYRPQAGHQAAAPARHGSAAHAASWADPSGMVNADGYHGFWWSGPVQVGRNGVEAEITRGGRKYRAQWRLKPGLSIVAHGISGRVGKLSGAGNAIVPQLAAEFIIAARDAVNSPPNIFNGRCLPD